MAEDPKRVFAELIAERGGAERLNVVQLGVTRALAAALSEDVPAASVISQLLELLPKPAAEQAGFDLTVLTNREFHCSNI